MTLKRVDNIVIPVNSIEIKDLPIDSLYFDPCNVRQTSWDGNQELIESVKRYGINHHLIVRPHPNNSNKYGIVCGSRRYNAAISAGLKEVPCKINYGMSDELAQILSLQENYHRKEMEPWENIDAIGLIHEKSKDLDVKDRIAYLAEKFSINAITVTKYARIFKLPEDIKQLIRPYNQRLLHIKQKLAKYPHLTKKHVLQIGTAEILARFSADFDEKRIDIFEASIFFLGKTVNDCKIMAQIKSDNPDESWLSIYNNIITKKKGYREVRFSLPLEEKNKLDDLAYRKNKNYRDLLRSIVKEWTENNLLDGDSNVTLPKARIEENKIIIEIEIDERDSKSGKMRLLATTGGFMPSYPPLEYKGKDIRFNLTIGYRK